jgi:hypothetical protein
MAARAAAEAKRRNATGMEIASFRKMNETRCHLSLRGRGDVTAIEKF